ncbi:MAG TPA: ABC transporter substrate-binding protein [Chloroflexota bacterium]|jgi:NitT/TauT family transport system substrate-binding protein
MTVILARILGGGLLAAALVLGAACGPGAAPAPAKPAAPPAAPAATAPASQAPVSQPPAAQAPTAAAQPPAALRKVRYGTLNIFGDAGIFIGMDEGYYAEQGIDVDLTSFDSAANMVAPLATNQIDAGGGAPSAGLYNALRTGVNVRIVADKGHSDPTPPGYPVSIYPLRKDLADSGRVKTVADLKGLRFGQPARGISPELDLEAYLKQGGLTPADLDVNIISFPDMVPAFANGNLDVAWSVEPFATTMFNQGSAIPFGYDYPVHPYHQVGVLLYAPEFSQSDLATKFMVGYLRGLRQYNDAFMKKEPTAREKTINTLINHTPVKNRALYDQMTFSALDPDGKMNLASFDEQQDYFLRTGTQQGRVDIQSYVDLQHIDNAARQLGPYQR